MEKKKISIVLPVYNGENYISESVESIISQTYRNWELIIVNDCSTDNTLCICEGFASKDDRIKVISNEKNLKLPGTLNAGFCLATGDYYTWTSDDNMYRPEALEVLARTLDHNPDAVMVYSDLTDIDGNGNIIESESLSDPEYIVTGNVIGACFLYTAVVAKQVGEYDESLFLAEDYDYWIRLYSCGKIIHIMDDLYLYRRHEESLSETKKAFVNEMTYNALDKNFEMLFEDSKKHGLEYAFFDQMMYRGNAHETETLERLLSVNPGYKKYLNRKKMIEGIKNTTLYKALRRLKRINRR